MPALEVMMKKFKLRARKAFRLPDGMMLERGAIFMATVRSKVVAGDEWFILGLDDQPEEASVPCMHVCFHEEPEASEVGDD